MRKECSFLLQREKEFCFNIRHMTKERMGLSGERAEASDKKLRDDWMMWAGIRSSKCIYEFTHAYTRIKGRRGQENGWIAATRAGSQPSLQTLDRKNITWLSSVEAELRLEFFAPCGGAVSLSVLSTERAALGKANGQSATEYRRQKENRIYREIYSPRNNT